MQEPGRGRNFWLGNAILAVALVMVLFIGPLWERLGVFAMMLWAIVAAAGAILVMADKEHHPPE